VGLASENITDRSRGGEAQIGTCNRGNLGKLGHLAKVENVCPVWNKCTAVSVTVFSSPTLEISILFVCKHDGLPST